MHGAMVASKSETTITSDSGILPVVVEFRHPSGGSMWPFSRKPLLDEETMSWHLDAFEWLVASFAGRRSFAASWLVLPAPGFFVYDHETGHALAERLFRQVEDYCDLPGSRLRLTPEQFVPDEGDALLFGRVQHGRHAMGTYSPGEIRHLPALIREPLVLIGTFAHELGHHLLHAGASTPPPIDGADEEEFLTDLAAVYLGFGVFLANQAFSFDQHGDTFSQGWRSSRRGYLPERDLVFGTAIFHAVKDLDPAPALSCLKPHLASQLKRALHDLDQREALIAAIRAKEPRFNAPLTAGSSL
jgi:hypothetical protein